MICQTELNGSEEGITSAANSTYCSNNMQLKSSTNFLHFIVMLPGEVQVVFWNALKKFSMCVVPERKRIWLYSITIRQKL